MDLYMGGWTPMRQTTELVSKRGATAANWFIHTPVCCPSRGEILSGRYFHNIRVPQSTGGCMHVDEDKVNPVSFAKYLGEAGYTAAYFGKHLNNCPPKPPPGFDCPTCRWFAYGGDTVPGHGRGGGYVDSAFYDFQGGQPVSGSPYHPVPGVYQANSSGEYAGYSASIVANKSMGWIRKVAPLGKPFVLTVGNRAPHAPFTPAPWYAEGQPASAWIDNRSAPRTPDYNASCPDFHWTVAHQAPITAKQAAQTDNVFRNRWRASMSVDDGVAGIVATVEDLGIQNRTYFFVTSDHGWNLGQHRLPGGKHNVYDHSTRIPMVIRGPGVQENSVFHFPASNVDVAPTMLGLAGEDGLSAHMDGRSVVPLLVDPQHPSVLPATRRHIRRALRLQALDDREAWSAASSEYARSWRTFHPIEFFALNNHTWFGHMIDDVVSNTYRALRFVGDPVYGDLLYAEFTRLSDWHFQRPQHYELFNMTKDPHQLENLYYHADPALTSELQRLLLQHWNCSGVSCL